MVFLAAGCSSSRTLTLRPFDQSHTEFTQSFPKAYLSRSPEGDYHVVLTDDGIAPTSDDTPVEIPIITPAKRKPGDPLQPISEPRLRQVVHLHVFWKPMRGAKADNPSATNAAIDWYVMSPSGQDTGFVHYQGAGFVTVYSSRYEATIEIRNATMRLHSLTGDMSDPLGPATLSGRVEASWNTERVDSLLETLRSLPVTTPSEPSSADAKEK